MASTMTFWPSWMTRFVQGVRKSGCPQPTRLQAALSADRSAFQLRRAIPPLLRGQTILDAKEFPLDSVKPSPEHVPRRFQMGETAAPQGVPPIRSSHDGPGAQPRGGGAGGVAEAPAAGLTVCSFPRCPASYDKFRKKPHPMYSTSSTAYGSKDPQATDLPTKYYGRAGYFTRTFKGGRAHDSALNTFISTSKVHNAYDGSL